MKISCLLSALIATLVSANTFAYGETMGSAKSTYVGNLIRGATVVRSLEQAQQNDNGENFEVDISSYSVKFEKCQFVKSYNDNLAENEESETVLATQRFVIFRLCPNNSCSTCSSGYGEYMIDLETYLGVTSQYHQALQQGMCNACAECGNNGDDQVAQDDDGAVEGDDAGQQQDDQVQEDNGDANRKLEQYNADCDSCYDECLKYENMDANYFVEATNFVNCQLIYDADDDSKGALYAGPMCASQGSKIKIGVFTDENCYINDASKDVDDYLVDEQGNAMQLSHVLLKSTYSSSSCVSCANTDNNNYDNYYQQNQVLEMCGELYEASAKCEQQHGFKNGYSAYDGYQNQAENEDVVCDFIDSISAGSYDEDGEIVVTGASSTYGSGSTTTSGQKFALIFFVFGTMGLATYAVMLHSKLTRGPVRGLASHDGAMA